MLFPVVTMNKFIIITLETVKNSSHAPPYAPRLFFQRH